MKNLFTLRIVKIIIITFLIFNFHQFSIAQSVPSQVPPQQPITQNQNALQVSKDQTYREDMAQKGVFLGGTSEQPTAAEQNSLKQRSNFPNNRLKNSPNPSLNVNSGNSTSNVSSEDIKRIQFNYEGSENAEPREKDGNKDASDLDKQSVINDAAPVKAVLLPTSVLNPEFAYDPTGRRDPFKPFKIFRSSDSPRASISPLQTFDLEKFKVIGILWDVNAPKAVVEDPSGKRYQIKKNTKIGRNNGYVLAIREGEIVVLESFDEGDKTRKEIKILEFTKN